MYTEHPDGAVLVVGNGEAGTIIIHTDGLLFVDGSDQTTWSTVIVNEYGREIYSNNDLRSPAYNDVTVPLEAMSAFVSFLLACAESKSEESDNYSLFPTEIREWAELYSDELQQVFMEDLDPEGLVGGIDDDWDGTLLADPGSVAHLCQYCREAFDDETTCYHHERYTCCKRPGLRGD